MSSKLKQSGLTIYLLDQARGLHLVDDLLLELGLLYEVCVGTGGSDESEGMSTIDVERGRSQGRKHTS